MEQKAEYALTEKERLMFQAVGQLMEEGMDLNRMKVSDITKRAGIGKGTAYEYVKSKEELIARALAFQLLSGMKEVEALMEGCPDFQGKIRVLFDWLEKNGERGYTLTNFIKLSMQSYEIARPFQEEWKKVMEEQGKAIYISLVKQLICAGREGGAISPQRKDWQVGQALVSHGLGFLSFLQHKNWLEEVRLGEMKEYACQGLLKCLK